VKKENQELKLELAQAKNSLFDTISEDKENIPINSNFKENLIKNESLNEQYFSKENTIVKEKNNHRCKSVLLEVEPEFNIDQPKFENKDLNVQSFYQSSIEKLFNSNGAISNTCSDLSQGDEFLLSELQEIKRQLAHNTLNQNLATQKWTQKEKSYKEMISKFSSKEEKSWDGVYENLIHKVENLKEDIDKMNI